jgi:hypothetical protein
MSRFIKLEPKRSTVLCKKDCPKSEGGKKVRYYKWYCLEHCELHGKCSAWDYAPKATDAKKLKL